MFAVSDNGANVRRCLIDMTNEDASMGWVPCIAHTLKLATRKCLDAQRMIKDIVAVMRTQVTKVTSSQPVKRRLIYHLNTHYPGEQHVKLQRDVDTRWNSTLTMLRTIDRQRDAIEALANDRIMRNYADFQRPASFQHWSEVFDLLRKVVNVLQPAEEATLMASSDDVSLSSYIPLIRGLDKQLETLEQRGDEAQGARTMVQEIRKEWQIRTKWVLQPQPVPERDAHTQLSQDTVLQTFHTATILDPRYKYIFFLFFFS